MKVGFQTRSYGRIESFGTGRAWGMVPGRKEGAHTSRASVRTCMLPKGAVQRSALKRPSPATEAGAASKCCWSLELPPEPHHSPIYFRPTSTRARGTRDPNTTTALRQHAADSRGSRCQFNIKSRLPTTVAGDA